MSNIKVIIIIIINTLFIFICANQINNGDSFWIFSMPLIGVTNRKYLDSDNKLTAKQKEIINVFFVVIIILFIIYIAYK